MKNLHMRHIFLVSILAILPIFGAGCSWVTLTPSGQKARVLSAQDVASCKKTGSTTVYTKGSLGPIPRADTVVASELSRLARNAAAGMGGDTVVAVTGIQGGSQSFDIYDCIGSS